MKTYSVRCSRMFKGKRITETWQVDAPDRDSASKKLRRFVKKTSKVPKTRILSVKIAKRKSSSSLRIR